MTLDSLSREFTHHALTQRGPDDYRTFASEALYRALSAGVVRSLSCTVFNWAAKPRNGKLEPILIIFYPGLPASILRPRNRVFLHELALTASLLFGCDHIRIEGSDRLCDVVREEDQWVIHSKR